MFFDVWLVFNLGSVLLHISTCRSHWAKLRYLPYLSSLTNIAQSPTGPQQPSTSTLKTLDIFLKWTGLKNLRIIFSALEHIFMDKLVYAFIFVIGTHRCTVIQRLGAWLHIKTPPWLPWPRERLVQRFLGSGIKTLRPVGSISPASDRHGPLILGKKGSRPSAIDLFPRNVPNWPHHFLCHV